MYAPKARNAFDEALSLSLQREHGAEAEGREFRKKVTESLEELDRKVRKQGYSVLFMHLSIMW